MPGWGSSEGVLGPAGSGFGSMPPPPPAPKKKTADEDHLSPTCPRCGQDAVEDMPVGADVAGSKPKCGNCGWEGKAQLV